MLTLSREQFVRFVDDRRTSLGHARATATLAVPLSARLLSDQLTPVLAYRRLVAPDQRLAPSFLFESVEGGERQGRYSIMGSRPLLRVVAFGTVVSTHDRRRAAGPTTQRHDDPLTVVRELSRSIRFEVPDTSLGSASLPACFLGGWVGYASYDAARYAEPDKLNPSRGPRDDRRLPEVQFGLYDGVVVFDHVGKMVHVVGLAMVGASDDPGRAYDQTRASILRNAEDIQRHSKPLRSGFVTGVGPGGGAAPRPETQGAPRSALASNTTRARHAEMVARALEYIRAGDVFQVVIGQRFERRSAADPFDVYRALRAVNPSPYMVYLQASQCILVASSPEILCRVRRETTNSHAWVLTNRPLAGTRPRGTTPDQDIALERELLADEKERAEHVMLVDLGRNDVGRVCEPGSVRIPDLMQIERYSHVMHISSTVTGELRDGLDCWDALRATLPVGTISGAPKIRAMQVIDELEPVRRGPYGGGMGWVGLDGQMDIALALRTMVVPTDLMQPARGSPPASPAHAQAAPELAPPAATTWMYHLQAAGGIVADSTPDAEYHETVNKAAALARAIDLAEEAFGPTDADSPSAPADYPPESLVGN